MQTSPTLRLLRTLAAGLAGLTALAATPAASAQTDASRIPDDAPNWLSMADAVATARADGKLVMIHNYAAWCGWCARLDQEVYTDDAVQAYLAEHYAVTRVDIESETVVPFFEHEVSMQGLGTALGVSGTPTTVFVGADGELITKLPGFAPVATFLDALKYVREGAYATMSFAQYQQIQRSGMMPLPQSAPDVLPGQ